MHDRIAGPGGRARLRILLRVLVAAALAVSVVAGCGAVGDAGAPVAVSHPVWLADGAVYYLREVSSEGAEVWRTDPGQGTGRRILGTEDIAGVCAGAVFGFLFRATGEQTGDEVGIATECPGRRMELVAYSPAGTELRPLSSTPLLSGVTFGAGRASGYVEQPIGCGTAIRPIRDGTVGDFAEPITVAGKTWMLSGAQRPDCGSVGWVRSPALAPDGSVYFLAAPDSVGKLPVTDPGELDRFAWYLCSWDGESSTPRVVTRIDGLADLAVSPDGQFVLAAVSTAGSGGVSKVDTTTGETTQLVEGQRAYHPSLSADGRRFVYVDNLTTLRFGSLPGGRE